MKNVMERAAILSSEERLQLNLPAAMRELVASDRLFSDTPPLEEVQRRYITHVLELTGGRIGGPGGAAKLLGMKRTTLQARMKKLGI